MEIWKKGPEVQEKVEEPWFKGFLALCLKQKHDDKFMFKYGAQAIIGLA